jgi:putative oxidoreductase
MTTALNTSPSASIVQRVISTDDSFAPLALRLAGGAIFVAHGAQKLFGAFGGYGLEGTGQFFDSVGLSPGYLMALLAGAVEFFGGLTLILGLLVRPAAVFAVHFSKGFFLDKGGYEYALAMLAVSVSLVFSGGGRASLDRVQSAKSE